MTDIKLDDIPDLVKSNKLSSQQACIQVYYTLYTNPARFGLLDLDEDSRSDFLLYFLQHKTESLLENYNPEISPFGAYIFKTIQTAKITFAKKMADRLNYNNIFIQDSIYDYQNQLQEDPSNSLNVAETETDFVSEESDAEKIPQLVYKKLFEKAPHRMAIADSHSRKLKRGILLLALKSAWYINDEQINRVSKICEIEPQIISSSICTLKSKLISKALSRQEIENNRNRAYCFVHNYQQQLQNHTYSKDDMKFSLIQKKIDFHKTNLQAKNKKLQSGRFKISPSNSDIAEIIGQPPRFVSLYIHKFKELDLNEIQSII